MLGKNERDFFDDSLKEPFLGLEFAFLVDLDLLSSVAARLHASSVASFVKPRVPFEVSHDSIDLV